MVTCLSPNGSSMYSGSALPDRLLVATLGGIVTAKRSGGAFGVVANSLPELHISALCFEPTRGAVFASSYQGGLYVSYDQGESWQQTAKSLDDQNIFSIASRTVGDAVTLYVGTEPVALFKSTDYGESWIELPGIREVPDMDKWFFPAPPHIAHLKNVSFDLEDPNTFYVSVEQGGLYKTVDGGLSFVELDGIVQEDDKVYKDVHRLLIHPAEPNRMFITGGDGFTGSENDGVTWHRILDRGSAIGYPDGLVVNPLDPKLMFVSGSKDNPGTWRESHNADAHVARSRDGGRSWEVVGDGLPQPLRANIEALSLSVSPGRSELFAGTTDGEVYSSSDEGEHFELVLSGLGPVSKGGHYRNLASAP